MNRTSVKKPGRPMRREAREQMVKVSVLLDGEALTALAQIEATIEVPWGMKPKGKRSAAIRRALVETAARLAKPEEGQLSILITTVRRYLDLVDAQRAHKDRCPFPREAELRETEAALRVIVQPPAERCTARWRAGVLQLPHGDSIPDGAQCCRAKHPADVPHQFHANDSIIEVL